MNFVMEIKKSILMDSLKKVYPSESESSLEDMINTAIQNIDSVESGIISLSDELTCEDEKEYLIGFHEIWFGIDKVIEICGGIKEESVYNTNKPTIFKLLLTEDERSNFENPSQFIVVREVLRRYFNYTFNAHGELKYDLCSIFYRYMPSDFKVVYAPDMCNIQFCTMLGSTQYQFIVLFNLQCGILIDIGMDGRIVRADAIILKIKTDISKLHNDDMRRVDISVAIDDLHKLLNIKEGI